MSTHLYCGMVLVENGSGDGGGVEENHGSDGNKIIASGQLHSLTLVMTNGEQIPANFE